jgi:cell division transport system permease protein
MIRWAMRHVQSALFAAGRLARSPLATCFTVLVIGIALTLPAALGLAVVSVRDATGGFSDAITVSVYLKPDVAVDKARQLAATLRQRSGVAAVKLVTSQQAEKSMREQGWGEELDALGENPLPHGLLVTPDAGADAAALEPLVRHIEAWPEVDQVKADGAWVQRLNALMELLRKVVVGASVLLGAGVLAVIGNTVRLEIFNRRAEIEVTKLVGGSNAFVRRPFLYTGLFYGLAGGLLASALVMLGLSLLNGPVTRLAQSYGSTFRLMTPGLAEAGALLAAGALLGLLGSAIAASRHLARIEPRP